MPGTGPAPKHPDRRVNRAPKARGEWVVLPDTKIKRPALPRPTPKGGWSEAAKREWDRFWASPMANMWDESDMGLVEQLLWLVDQFWDKPTASLNKEIRQLRDYLGLTPKGRQDRRWKLPDEWEGEPPKPALELKSRPDPRK